MPIPAYGFFVMSRYLFNGIRFRFHLSLFPAVVIYTRTTRYATDGPTDIGPHFIILPGPPYGGRGNDNKKGARNI